MRNVDELNLDKTLFSLNDQDCKYMSTGDSRVDTPEFTQAKAVKVRCSMPI